MFTNRTEITVELDRDRVVAGDTVAVRVAVGEPDRRTRGGRIELLYRNTYKYEHRDSDGDRSTRTATEDVVVAGAPLFPDGTPAAGYVDAQLTVPAEGPGSDPKAVAWLVRAVVDRRRARDARAEAPLTVLIGADAHASWAERPVDSPPACPMRLEVSARHVLPGDRLRGALELHPAEAVAARAVRVQLRRLREDEDDERDTEVPVQVELARPGELPAGMPQRYSFELDVPVDAGPSFLARRNRQHWYLEAVVDRALRGDHVGRLEINLHTAP